LVFVIRLIDIGNYVQLAQSVQAIASEFVASGVNGKLKPLESPRYTAETLRAERESADHQSPLFESRR
jgi:hypothetical protein